MSFSTNFIYSQSIHESLNQKSSQWKSPSEKISKEALIYSLKQEFPEFNFKSIESKADQLGFTHHKYQIELQQIPVEGLIYSIHEKNGIVVHHNGELINSDLAYQKAAFSSEDALQFAMNIRNADLYAWQTSQMDNQGIKYDKPQAQLCWMNAALDLQSPMTLCYKIDLFSIEPYQREWMYINAMTGDLVTSINRICEVNVEGTAKTAYHGVRKIITDSVAPNKFLLRDMTRGGGVITLNAQSQGVLANSIDFEDQDNYWDNKNTQKDEIATDAHFGAEATYDYFKKYHNRNSIDDKGLILYSLVHFLDKFNNATWSGTSMNYGDGDGVTFKPFTKIDVCGHEISHGFTELTSGLIYSRESGALNESISDIFGAAINQEVYQNTNIDWSIGRGIYVADSNKALRQMNDPFIYSNPKYYKGNFWYFGTMDNGGVHTNSGVFNYWFYLLTDGLASTNEVGFKFNVQKLGLVKAAQIVYRMNAFYLKPRSNHFDAYFASIKAAEDLFGKCSPEIKSVQMAWAVVGVTLNTGASGDLYTSSFTQLKSTCYLGNSESVNFAAINGSCDISIPSGSKVYYGVSVNNAVIYKDSLITTKSTEPGDSINFIISNKLNLSIPAKYKVYPWFKLASDTTVFNDTLKLQIERYDPSKIDYSIRQFNSNSNFIGCTDSGPLKGYILWKNAGCDPIAPGTKIPIGVLTPSNLETISFITVTERSEKGDSAYLPFYIDLTGVVQIGSTQYKVFIKDPNDINRANDTLRITLTKKQELFKETLLTGGNQIRARDTVSIISNLFSTCNIATPYAISAPLSIRMSGGNPNTTNFSLIPPANESEIWSLNPLSKSSACICANAQNMNFVKLKFKRKHHISTALNSFVPKKDYKYLSSMRILINGVPLPKTYYAEYPNDTLIVFDEAVNLSQYKGTRFELCFESFTGLESSSDPKRIGDVVWIDDIILVDEEAVNTNDHSTLSSNYNLITNPASQSLLIKCNDPSSKTVKYSIVDMSGKLLDQQEKEITDLLKVNIEKINPGIYLLKIESKGKSESIKFVKN